MRKIEEIPEYQRTIASAHLASARVPLEVLFNGNRPIIAVVNSWNEVCPGHITLRDLAESVKNGILAAGGYPLEFNTIAMCDGIAQGHAGMKYSLPSREVIADSVEVMVSGHGIFDGLVFLASCDKIIPGMLLAAARLDLPCLFVTSGPMFPFVTPEESKEYRHQYLNGRMTARELVENTLKYYPGPGVCPFYGTANTMAVLTEAMGLMLPGTSLLPSFTALRYHKAYESGIAAVELIKKGLTVRRLVNEGSLTNAMTVLSATGGSLNALLHLMAFSEELGIKVTWKDFERISQKTPLLTALTPSGPYTAVDFWLAGGVPSLMRELGDLIVEDALTVSLQKIGTIAASSAGGDGKVIRRAEDPIQHSGGIMVLGGSLAPGGALVKVSAVPPQFREFAGPAMVFESEEECHTALREKQIKPGTVVVVRGEGPKGGPGMRELHRATEVLKEVPNTALVTDGRLSGATSGLCIAYLCPEAAEPGAPIGLVQSGDLIEISLSKKTVDLKVSVEELSSRTRKAEDWLSRSLPRSVLRRYAGLVQSASKGAVLGE